MKYYIDKLFDRIYLISADDHYDLAMLFCRYQEYYESPYPQFRGKKFELLDFMDFYAKNGYSNGSPGCFSYPTEWAGFNIKSSIIEEVRALGISDENKYDRQMQVFYDFIKNECNGESFYLIGSNKQNKQTIAHEVAHGLFFTNDDFKKEALELNSKINANIYFDLIGWLKTGYAEEVWEDEIQAYASTGIPKTISVKYGNEWRNNHISLFKKFSSNVKLINE